MPSEKYIGQKFTNKYGEVAEIIMYHNAEKVDIRFDNGVVATKAMSALRKGSFTSNFSRTVSGVGFLGNGEYLWKNSSKAMRVWCAMLARCYDETVRHKYPTYAGCTVHPDWHNYQTFAEWYMTHPLRQDGWHVDKDFTVKGNKEYGPATCTFVPHEVNSFLANSRAKRGKYPVGVSWSKPNNGFVARCKVENNRYEHLGTFSTVEEAFQAYKSRKELYGKYLAEKFQGRISEAVYNSLMNFEVTIDD